MNPHALWPWLILGAAVLLLAIATRLGRRMRAVQPVPFKDWSGNGRDLQLAHPTMFHVPGRDFGEIADRLIALTVLHHHEEGA